MSREKKKSKEAEVSLIDDDISDDELTMSTSRAERKNKEKLKKTKKPSSDEEEESSESEAEKEDTTSKKRKKKAEESASDEESEPSSKKKQKVAEIDADAVVDADADADADAMSDSESESPRRCDVRACRAGLIPFKLSSVDPTDDDLLNPNYQFQLYHNKYYTEMHYTQVFPTLHMMIKHTPGTKYSNVATTLEQKCDFLCNGNFVKKGGFYPFTNSFSMQLWSPFGVVSDPQMYPHGNKDPLRANDKYGPANVSDIRMRLPLRSDEYASKLGMDNGGVRVDRDHHAFFDYWVQGFDTWIRSDAVWKYSEVLWPMRLKAVRKLVDEELIQFMKPYNKQMEKFETKLQQWNEEKAKAKKLGKKAPPAPVEPVNPEAEFKYDEKVRELFLKDFKSPVNSRDKHSHMLYSRRLFVTLTKKENEAIKNGEAKGTYHAPTEFAREQYENPPSYENKQTKEVKPGFRRKIDPVRMYRGITPEERQQMNANKIGSQSCMARVPFECAHVVDGDIISARFNHETYDSPFGAGWRQNLSAILWIGTKGTLDMTRKKLDGVDPTSYFLVAQRYTRTKDFKSTQSVESSGVGGMTDEEAAQWNEFISY